VALDISRAARDRWGTGVTPRTIGELHLAAGRYPAADRYLADALAIWDEVAAHLLRARTLRDLAQLREAQGEPAAAKTALDEALETFHAHGARGYAELTVAPRLEKTCSGGPHPRPMRKRLLLVVSSAVLALLLVPVRFALADANCTVYNGFSVCGAIRDKYLALGGPNGFLGVPVTNELPTPTARAGSTTSPRPGTPPSPTAPSTPRHRAAPGRSAA
jgi:hypothetical protein